VVKSGEWSIADAPLKPQDMGVAELEKSVQAQGLLGSDTMSTYASVVFDYTGARLMLGAG
jgi:hypothetical protein